MEILRLDALSKEEIAEMYAVRTVKDICKQFNLTPYMFYQLIDGLGIRRKNAVNAKDLLAKIKSN
jgi:hypothetical protein